MLNHNYANLLVTVKEFITNRAFDPAPHLIESVVGYCQNARNQSSQTAMNNRDLIRRARREMSAVKWFRTAHVNVLIFLLFFGACKSQPEDFDFILSSTVRVCQMI